jgi:hypothetical protein
VIRIEIVEILTAIITTTVSLMMLKLGAGGVDLPKQVR